jgi:hypothetical protein
MLKVRWLALPSVLAAMLIAPAVSQALKRKVPRGRVCAALCIYDWRHFVTEQCHFVY